MAGKYSKLSMPEGKMKKKGAAEEEDMAMLDDELFGELMAEEEDLGMEEDMEGELGSPVAALAELSDEELLEEMRRRGLAEGEEEEEMPEEGMA